MGVISDRIRWLVGLRVLPWTNALVIVGTLEVGRGVGSEGFNRGGGS